MGGFSWKVEPTINTIDKQISISVRRSNLVTKVRMGNTVFTVSGYFEIRQSNCSPQL